MRTAHGTIQTHLNLTTQNRALLLRLTRKDEEVFRLTNRDVPLTWDDGDGDEVYSAGGFLSTAVLTAVGVGIQGLNITLKKDAAVVTQGDLEAGLWKDCQVLLVEVDAGDPNAGHLVIFGGDVAKIGDDKEGGVSFEVRGLIRNSRIIKIEAYSWLCRADLGDERCGVDIDALKENFTVAVVANSQRFTTVELGEADNHWNLGVLRWLTGANTGVAMEVKLSVSATKSITMAGPMPFAIAPGDTGEIWPGCDKSLSTCIARYDNAVNFRGEPYIPLPDAMEPAG